MAFVRRLATSSSIAYRNLYVIPTSSALYIASINPYSIIYEFVYEALFGVSVTVEIHNTKMGIYMPMQLVRKIHMHHAVITNAALITAHFPTLGNGLTAITQFTIITQLPHLCIFLQSLWPVNEVEIKVLQLKVLQGDFARGQYILLSKISYPATSERTSARTFKQKVCNVIIQISVQSECPSKNCNSELHSHLRTAVRTFKQKFIA